MAATSPPASFPSEAGDGASRSAGRRFRVGLTGGIGSGKSLVADELTRLGAYLIDADAIAHALTAAGGAAIDPIRARFGASFIDAGGALERARMREHVFSDSAARQALEDILHPMIAAAAQAGALAAPAASPYLVFAIPLLIESATWRGRVDRVLVVDCADATQVSRVVRRSGIDEAAARSIIAQQAARAARLEAADDVLVNEGTPAAARSRVQRLHALYRRLAGDGLRTDGARASL